MAIGSDKKSKTTKQISCFKCRARFPSRSLYLKHLACDHFQKILLSKYEKEGHRCSVCDLQQPSRVGLLKHLICKHDVLKEFLTSDNQNSEKQRTYKCFKCPYEHRTYCILFNHIARVHFQSVIVEKYVDVDAKCCKVCKFTSRDKRDLVHHIASKHNVLEGLVPHKSTYFITNKT
jgi:hypothetical protein